MKYVLLEHIQTVIFDHMNEYEIFLRISRSEEDH